MLSHSIYEQQVNLVELSTEQLGALCRILMVCDPFDGLEQERDVLEAIVNSLVVAAGFTDWVDAYHRIPQPDRRTLEKDMAHDLDAIRQAIEERDAAIQACDDLANKMVYKGNSVCWWHSKAIAYRDAIGRCWDALHDAGIHADGKTDVATAIRQLAERVNSESATK